VTTLHLRHRQPVSLGIGAVVAFAAFAVAGLRALFASSDLASSAPTFDEIVLRVQWPLIALLALGLAVPAAILSTLDPPDDARSPARAAITLLLAVVAIGAIGIAYLVGPSMVGTGVAGPGAGAGP
jgi:hypothetical protein